jgi:hypothetical protein
MARKKNASVAGSEAASAEAGKTAPAEPASDTLGNAPAGEAQPVPPPDSGPRQPLYVLSYLLGKDTYVQASIWARPAAGADGPFTAYDVSLRKRYKDPQTGEWKSLYSFRSAELFAATHALEKAEAWILDTRAAACPF